MLALAVGLFFICLAEFTYETTDRRIQSTVQDLWLELAYYPRTPIGDAKRLARIVLDLMNRFFDRIFGPRQLSIRTLFVAFCYAYGAIPLALIPVSLLARVAQVPFDSIISMRVALIAGATAFAIGTLPAVHASLRWVTYISASGSLASFGAAVWAFKTGRLETNALPESTLDPTSLLVVFFLSIICGVGVVHAIRYGVHAAVQHDATRNLALLTNILVIPLVTFAALVFIAVTARHPRGLLTVWLGSLLQRSDIQFLLFPVGGLISVWGYALCIALALSLFVLLNLAMWPAIRFIFMKMLYSAQRQQLIHQKGTLRSIGLAFVACALAPRGELVTKIIRVIFPQ